MRLLIRTLNHLVSPSSRHSERRCTDWQAFTISEHGGPAIAKPKGSNLSALQVKQALYKI